MKKSIRALIICLTIIAVAIVAAVVLLKWKKQNVSSHQGLLDVIGSGYDSMLRDSFQVTGSSNRNDLVATANTGNSAR
jgi:opacity protein-like surface antigen